MFTLIDKKVGVLVLITLFATIIAFTPEATNAAPPVVKTVPWVATNPLIPHDTWSGKEITLKGSADVEGADILYDWDFGDGTPVDTGMVTNKYAIEANHAYSGSVGTIFTARLTVRNTTTGENGTEEYYIQIREKALLVEVNVGVDEGLWYLHKTQERTTENGIDFGDWLSGGYASSGWYGVTAANVNAFEVNGHLGSGDPSNPYVDTVKRGMGRLFTWLTTDGALSSTQTNPLGTFNPDSNGNGYGVYVNQSNPFYQGGMFMDAIIASDTPNAITTTGEPPSGSNPGILGRTYTSIVQDMVDSYAYCQYDGSGGGGWRYSCNEFPDNSSCQWAAIGLIAAERVWGLTIPEIVKDWNVEWLKYSQDTSTGWFGYTSSSPVWGPYATTPSGMVQMAMDGIGRGYFGSPSWDKAETFISDNFCNVGNGYNNVREYYYGLFSFVKAMLLHDSNGDGVAEPIKLLVSQTNTANNIDWYSAEANEGDRCDGVARTIVNHQTIDEYWYGHGLTNDQYPFETAFAIMMLNRTIFEAGAPVAVGRAIPNPAEVGQTISLNGLGSYHQDISKTIVSWEWDIDNDGIFDKTGPIVSTSFSALGNYPVRLRVTDNGVPQKSTETIVIVRITTPPIAPTANAGGPYVFCVNRTPWYLDGSGSVNPDEGEHEPGPNPGDTIAGRFYWDLDGDGLFDDATGVEPDVTGLWGVGSYLIQLKVTDTSSISFPTWGADLSNTDSAQVFVRAPDDPVCLVSASIDGYSISATNVTVGDSVIIGFSFTNTGTVPWTFGAGATLRKPDGTRIDFLKPITVNPGASGSVQWTRTIDMEGRWDIVFGVWKESTHPLENLLVQTGWVPEGITAIPENQLPTCSIKLLRNGTPIDKINVREFLDIYVGDSTDDTGIKQVHFLSDESQNGKVDQGFTWTKWYGWNSSSDAWDQSRKTMAWSFATSGEKELWVELEDETGQDSKCSANIFVEYPEFRFVHMTDAHIGWGSEMECIPSVYAHAESTPAICMAVYPRFIDTLENIRRLSPKPDFILITGDNVEYAKKDWFDHFKTILDTFSMKHNIPVYVIPGNHDRYEHVPLYNATEEYFFRGGNDFLQQYYISMETPEKMNGVSILDTFNEYSSSTKSLENGINRYNYKFEYDGYFFIGLDSGEDYYDSFGFEDYFDFGPESSGLSSKHMDALKALDKDKPKIIFMHHPVVTGGKDGEYEDASIVYNRTSIGNLKGFLDYCKENNVQMVLSGHTHEDHIFNGDAVDLGVKNWGVEAWRGCTTDCPWFIQTPSAVKDGDGFPHGYRIVRVKDGSAYTGEYIPTKPVSETAVVLIGSGILNVYDSQGRHTGFGSIIVDIPDSYYNGYYDSTAPQITILYNKNEDYKFEVVGTEEGTYGLTIVSLENGEPTTFTAIDIPTSPGTIHEYFVDWYMLSQGGKGVTVRIDSEGNGVFERTIFSDSELTRDEFIEQPPVADAGSDQTVLVGNDCRAKVTFNGTGSFDPDGDTLTYTWTGSFGTANGPTPTVNLPLGTHTITLTVDDSKGGKASDNVTITIKDGTPPNITKLAVSPNVLWPPNHKMIPVSVNVSASDNCDSKPVCKITSVSSNEPENGLGDGDTAPDWKITGNFTANLRAERSGNGSGRIYTLTITCNDTAGNSSIKWVTVKVPHDQGKK